MALTEIIQRVVAAARKFYSGQPLDMEDREYDTLLAQIKADDPSFNIFDQLMIPASERHRHPFAYDAPGYKIQFNRVSNITIHQDMISYDHYVLPKYDGCSVSAYYYNGNLKFILTRADECLGIVQTEKLRNKVPTRVDPRIHRIDFEAVCSIEDFGEASRGKANGLINSKYMQAEVDRYLELIPFGFVFDGIIDFHQLFFMCGYNPGEIIFDWHCMDPNILNKDAAQALYKGRHYPTDGYAWVEKTNHAPFHRKFGLFKFYYTEIGDTEVIDIEWNLSNKNSFIPKVIVKPVKVTGKWISRAATGGHRCMMNYKMGIGAKIEVVFANSTIPHCTRVIEESQNWGKMQCYCGSPLKDIAGTMKCSDPKCPIVTERFLSHLLSQRGLKSVDTPEVETLLSSLAPSRQLKDWLLCMICGLFIERLGNKAAWVSKHLLNQWGSVNETWDPDVRCGGLSGNNLANLTHYKPLIKEFMLKLKKYKIE